MVISHVERRVVLMRKSARIAVELMGEPTVDERPGFYLAEGDPARVIFMLIYPTLHQRGGMRKI